MKEKNQVKIEERTLIDLLEEDNHLTTDKDEIKYISK